MPIPNSIGKRKLPMEVWKTWKSGSVSVMHSSKTKYADKKRAFHIDKISEWNSGSLSHQRTSHIRVQTLRWRFFFRRLCSFCRCSEAHEPIRERTMRCLLGLKVYDSGSYFLSSTFCIVVSSFTAVTAAAHKKTLQIIFVRKISPSKEVCMQEKRDTAVGGGGCYVRRREKNNGKTQNFLLRLKITSSSVLHEWHKKEDRKRKTRKYTIGKWHFSGENFHVYIV